MRPSTPLIVGLSALAAMAIGVGGMIVAGGWTLDGALMGTRLTARWAFPWFIAAWSASALAALFPGGWRTMLLRRRRAVGLAFAANHGVHLAFIALSAFVFHHPTARITLIGGGSAYVLILAMAATSTNAAMRTMGVWWKVLHTTGSLAVLAIFTNSYAGRLAGKPWLAIPALALIALAVTIKLAAFAKRRMRQPQAA